MMNINIYFLVGSIFPNSLYHKVSNIAKNILDTIKQ